MKSFVVLGFVLLSALACSIRPAQSASVTVCGKKQLLAYVPDKNEVKAHRQSALPIISYPYGTQRDGGWGLHLTVRVDEAGQVICYSPKDQFDRDQPLNNERRAALGALRYAPFQRDGVAVSAIVTEQINEQELPEKHLPLPEVPLGKVHIALERTGCFGSCPSYKVDIYGDGRVVYKGGSYVDVEDEHAYRVPPEGVAQLVDSLRTKDIWSLRPSYRAAITDNPTYVLTMDMGGQVHRLEDYVGEMVGMPPAVSDFEDEVDKVARSNMWVNLSQEGVERLKAEGFRFDSQAGADLLARAVANDDSHDDEAMLRLVELGAPISGASPSEPGFLPTPGPLIEAALKNHRAVLIDPLIARGALNAGGRPDQGKIDAAFRAAIAGGRLALVRKIWEVRGDRPHPSLTFDDVSDDDKPIRKKSPVTLLLSHYSYQKADGWEGLEIARWLAAQGCDIKAAAASGTTLLHIAAEAGDANFVRYLLDQGIDASTPGEFGLPALGSAQDEDVALVLLEAGTDFARMDDSGRQFLRYAESMHWQRVVAWLTAHGRG